MTTTDARAATLHQIRADMQRVSRAQSIAQDQQATLERAGELALAGLWQESRFVAMQGRTA